VISVNWKARIKNNRKRTAWKTGNPGNFNLAELDSRCPNYQETGNAAGNQFAKRATLKNAKPTQTGFHTKPIRI
jgi:hypothetical protein